MRENMVNTLELKIVLTILAIVKGNKYFIQRLNSIENYLLIFLTWDMMIADNSPKFNIQKTLKKEKKIMPMW